MHRPGFFAHITGTAFYSGLMPVAPGTFASLTALLPVYPIAVHFGGFGIAAFVALFCFVTVWVSPSFEKAYGQDPPQLVSDEWAGQAIPFMSIPLSGNLPQDLPLLIGGFLLFRFFDIAKPLGVSKLQKLPSGYGIVMDDILAGIYALISLKLLIFAIL